VVGQGPTNNQNDKRSKYMKSQVISVTQGQLPVVTVAWVHANYMILPHLYKQIGGETVPN
jgi:hypothetical protein